MLKLQLITVIDFRYKIKIKFFFTEGLFLSRAHQTRRSGRNSRPISAEVALPRLQSEIKVALFLFANHSFLPNNLRFMPITAMER
jgi:hypothetical protein